MLWNATSKKLHSQLQDRMNNRSTTILIIDDQIGNLMALSSMLNDLLDDATVLTASSGPEGIEIAGREHPDVILLDVIMPGMDGFEVCQHLKESPQTRHIPIIMITGIKTDSNNLSRGLELGADAFLSKPIDEMELVAQIKVMLRIKKAEDRLRAEKVELEELVDKKVSELKKIENLYQTLIKTCPDGFASCSIDGKVIDSNPAFNEIVGYSADELKEMSIKDLTPEKWLNAEFPSPLSPLKFRKNHRFEKEYRRKDGSLVPVFLSTWITEDEAGNPEHMNAFVQNITEKKEAERERSLLASSLEQTIESVIITDKSGQIIYVNPAFERTSGFPKDEVIGKHLDTFNSDIQNDHINQQIWDLLGEEKVWSGTIVTKRKDDTLLEEEVTISPIRDETGVVANFVVVRSDTSKEKQLERQLLQAQKMEALGTLAGGIAHDFNNVLHGLSMSTHTTLKKLPEDTPVKKYLARMLVFCERGAALVKQILTFSRQVEEDFDIIDIAPIIKEVLVMMRSALPATISIEQSLPKTTGNIQGNLSQIHQVVMNLCTNAGYAMREKGGILKVSLENKAVDHYNAWKLGLQEGEFLRLTISDSGTGMPKSVQERIFDPFYTTKPKGEGTGLGLSVVHGIIKAHKGHILVESQLGKGATFRVYFPVVKQEAATNDSVQNDELRGNEHILLVDDEDSMLDLLKNILTDLGYTVSTAQNGKQALDLFNQSPDRIDLLLTDQTMPEMTGDELAEKLLTIDPDFPVILMTGFSYRLDQERIKKLHINHVIMKPFEINQLGKAIRSLLEKRRDL